MAYRVQQRRRRRRGIPLGLAVAFLLASGVVNLAAIRGASSLLETEPFSDEREELLVVDLTEPAELEPEQEPEQPEPEQEPEPPELEKQDFELVEPEPPEPEEEEPEPEPEPEPEQEQPEEPPQELEMLDQNMKMVEQLDQFDEPEDNDSADYLSNINRKVAEQTRAEITNMVEDALEAKASQLEPTPSPERGTANEDKPAETQDQRSADTRQAPRVRPEEEEARPEQNDPQPESMLATRELAPKEHSEAMVAQEDLAIEAEDGVVDMARPESASVLEQDQQAKNERRDPRYKFRLSRNEMDAAFGHDKNAPKNVESLEMSKKEGVWDNARAAYQSPLENVVPEVQAGNQTALNSRKHPFARYIAAMHRGIHSAWAYGYLASLDKHPNSHPLNDYTLFTKVEIVLKSDGTIDKVRTVHHSGNSSFDAAAREIVHATGPYPNPPKAIRSGNGKIYMHWEFHRDERACGTFGAKPYILDNAGQGDIPNAHSEVELEPRGGGAPSSKRAMVRAEGPNVVGPGSEVEELRRGGQGRGAVNEGPQRPPAATPKPNMPIPEGGGRGPVSAAGANGTGGLGTGNQGRPGQGVPGGTGAPGSGRGSGGGAGHGHGHGSHIPTGGRGALTGEGPPPAKPKASKSKAGSGGLLGGGRSQAEPKKEAEGAVEGAGGEKEAEGKIDPVATAVAKNWVRAFTKGQVTTMVNRSAVPFRSGSAIAAKSKDELQGLLEALADEVKGKKAKHDGTYTAAGLRKKFGSVPAGVAEGEGRLYAVFTIAGDSVIVMLQKRYGSWRIVGLTR